jgi:hypothetical protein
MIGQDTKQKASEILNKFGQFGSKAWSEVKSTFLSLDPQTQRMLLTAMFKINPEQAKLFAGEAGITTSPGTPGEQKPPEKKDNTLIFVIVGVVILILVVVSLVFLMKKK